MVRSVESENSLSQSPRNGAPGASSSSTNPVRVLARPDPFLVVCRCFSVLTAIAGILCITVNVLSAVQSFKNGLDIFDGIFRCYAVVIALFVVVAETEWAFIMKFSKVLEYWAGRGMLQIFVAVMTKAYPEDNKERKDLVLLQNIACYMLLSCGVVYLVSVSMSRSLCPVLRITSIRWIISLSDFLDIVPSLVFCKGILCIGHLKRTHQKKEVSRDQAVKDLEELERQREELEALLLLEERF